MCNPKTTYEELCSVENLDCAFRRARRGKTQKKYVIAFEEHLKQNLQQLRTELLMQTYRPQPLETFILRDPKTRRISKSDFRDRIMHHAICNIIEPIFDKGFIHDSFANRIGKGTLNAVKRFDQFKRKVSKNNTVKCFVLKADVKHYFETVSHDTLLTLLKRKITDERILWLIKIILENHETKIPGKGMPLGNLTSQFFANVYLNELDQFVKHILRAKYYVRYVDDFVILHRSRRLLEEYKQKIDVFLEEELSLKLHPDKSQTPKLEKGVVFLGFRVFFHHKLLNKKNIRKFERRFKKMKYLYHRHRIDREKVVEKFEGWLAYASHAQSYKYRKKITGKFNQYFPAQPGIQITSVKKHENMNKKVEASNITFSYQKTLHLFKKGVTIQRIAQRRDLKEKTVWEHIAYLVEFHQLPLKRVLPNNKIKKILHCIKTPQDKLKEIKNRVNDDSITYDEINCVLANVKGKHKKKSIVYFIQWYQRTNCYRKCYYNKEQQNACRKKFQILAVQGVDTTFTKKEFLDFFNNHTTICVLPEIEKRRFISWREFKATHRKKRETIRNKC